MRDRGLGHDTDSEHDADVSDAILLNEDWRLLPDGLEHRANGYFIAREALAARRGDLWEWPLHLSEKAWCRSRALRDAFLSALAHFGIEPDGHLARSFALGFGIRAADRGVAPDGFVRLGEVAAPRAAKPGRPGGRETNERRATGKQRAAA